MTEVKLPPIAEGVSKASITYWFKAAGEKIAEGEDLVELVTDKASFVLPSPSSGTVNKILAAEGDEVKVGELLALIS